MNDFVKYLTNIRYASEKEKNTELWDIEGILKKSNRLLKFDTRPVSKFKDEVGKIVRVKSKADKIVFKDNNNYILIDLEELNNYVKKHKLKKVYLKNIIKKLEWNVIL